MPQLKYLSQQIIDAHFHLWDLDEIYYGWLTDQYYHDHPIGDYRRICKNYKSSDFIHDTEKCRIVGGVHIQAAVGISDPTLETDFVSRDSGGFEFPVAIIGEADPSSSNFAEVIEKHRAYSQFRGIRSFPKPMMMTRTTFKENVRSLGKHGLVYDADVDPDTMLEFLDLVQACPETRFIIGHAGFPKERSSEYFKRWSKVMESSAKFENVTCKISGLGMVDHKWTISSIRPWVETTLDIFGVDRCMFASNWPVDSLFSTYNELLSAYHKIFAESSTGERNAFFNENAKGIYNLC